MTSAAAEQAAGWAAVCRYGDLQPERGVAALIGGVQVALFRTFDGTVYAIGNQDPFTGAQVPLIGDGVNKHDIPTQETFPYVPFALSGRDRVVQQPGSKVCAQPAGCPAQ